MKVDWGMDRLTQPATGKDDKEVARPKAAEKVEWDAGRLTGEPKPEPTQGIVADQDSGGKFSLEQLVAFPSRNMDNAPSLGAQMGALFRTGREDFLNALWGQATNREPGEPATPTQMQTNQDLHIVDSKEHHGHDR